jgi:hypothetical protein
MIRVHWHGPNERPRAKEEFENLEEFHEELVRRYQTSEFSRAPWQTNYYSPADFEHIHGVSLEEMVESKDVPTDMADALRAGKAIHCTTYGENGGVEWHYNRKSVLELALEWCQDDGAGFRIEEIKV